VVIIQNYHSIFNSSYSSLCLSQDDAKRLEPAALEVARADEADTSRSPEAMHQLDADVPMGPANEELAGSVGYSAGFAKTSRVITHNFFENGPFEIQVICMPEVNPMTSPALKL